MKAVLQSKLEQGRASLKEAEELLTGGADLNFVMNSLYYAFLYPVLGLLQARNIPTPLQSAAIALFEREYVLSGDVDVKFLTAMRRASELRPSCDCEVRKRVSPEDIGRLMPLALEFLERAAQIAE